MADQEKTKIIVLEPVTKSVQELLKGIEQKGQYDLERVSSSAEVVQLSQQFEACMLVVCLMDNNQMPDRVGLMKKLEGNIKKGLVKTMFVSAIKNTQLANFLSGIGVTDYIQEPVPVRTMQFKANLQLKAVDTVLKQIELKKKSADTVVFKKSEAAKPADAPAASVTARAQPALQLQQDAFLFKNSGVKKNGKKFIVDLEGPDPETGEWKEHEDKGNALTCWRWVPHEDEEGKALSDKGDGWVHTGEKPVFSAQTDKWQMSSEKPDLSYLKDGRKIATKLSTNSTGEVNVAADSEAAAANVEKTKRLAAKRRERVTAKAAAALLLSPEEKKARADAEAPEEDDPSDSPAAKMLKKMRREKIARARAAIKAKAATREDSAEEAPPEEATEEATGDGAEEEAGEEASEEGAGSLGKPRKQKARKAKPSALDFLKQKMAKQASDDLETEELEASAEANPEPEAAGEEEEAAGPARANRARKKPKNAADKSLASLARPKGLLEISAGTEENEEEEPAPATAERDETGPAEEDPESAASLRKMGRSPKPRAVPRTEGTEAPGEEDSSGEGAAASRGPKKARKRKNRREVLAEIQARLNSPLPEELPPEEEERLREKFGLEGRKDIAPKDLARKERLDAVKRLKEELETINREEAEEKAEPKLNLHDTSEEEQGWSRSGLTEEKRQSLLRAFDSEEAAETEEENGAVAKGKKRGNAGEEKDLYADSANYMPVAALEPPGNAWEATGSHYIYLNSQVRYRGFENLEELLPLWIFKGEKIPELLDKTQRWRFYGNLPAQSRSVKEIPPSVRDFLMGLRDTLRRSREEARQEKIAGAEARAEEERLAEEAAAELAEAERAARPETQADGLEDSFKKTRSPEGDKLARLRNQLETGAATAAEEAKSAQENAEDPAEGGAASESGEAAALTETNATLNKMKESCSPAMQAFLEKRRQKKEAGPAPADAAQEAAARAAALAAASPMNAYLGIYVSLSNSLAGTGHREKSVARVLKAIQISFELCSVALLSPEPAEEFYRVMQAEGPHLESGGRVKLEGGFSAPIKTGDGEAGKILGYLFLLPAPGREPFLPDQEAAVRRAAAVLWPALAREQADNEREEAA